MKCMVTVYNVLGWRQEDEVWREEDEDKETRTTPEDQQASVSVCCSTELVNCLV